MQNILLLAPRIQAAILRAVTTQQKEAAAFLTRWYEEELKLNGEIGEASTFKDAFTACVSFWQDAASQCAHLARARSRAPFAHRVRDPDELRNKVSVAADSKPLREAV
jgi:hypothetical protein